MNLKKITIIIASLLFILATPASLAQPRPPYSGAGSSIIGPPPPSMDQGDKTVKFMKVTPTKPLYWEKLLEHSECLFTFQS